MTVLNEFNCNNLYVRIYKSREAMGKAAAFEAAACLREQLSRKDEVNLIFAAAPSQNEFIAALANADDISWEKVNAFHMDEYIGLSPDHPAGFGNFLSKRIFSKLPFKQLYYINGQAQDPETEARRYAGLLEQMPADIVFMGVGENGHIAFNDPPVADFDDPMRVKVVTLDQQCRLQQVHDGCFATLEEVPVQAITLTIPELMNAHQIFCMVPAKTKAEAVMHLLTEEPNTGCPATILKTHANARLYLDRESAGLLDLEE